MGIFQETCELVNRTSKQLEIVFDGQRVYLEPNYLPGGKRIANVHNVVPRQVIPFALNQNVIMGSEEAQDPSAFQSLVGVIRDPKKDKRDHTWFDCSYTEQTGELTRTPLADVLEDPTMKIIVRGKAVPSASDAALPGVPVPFDQR